MSKLLKMLSLSALLGTLMMAGGCGGGDETSTTQPEPSQPVFIATDYYPLNVNDWIDMKDNTTGTVRRSSVTGVKDINGVTTKIASTGEGNIRYRTSDASGVKEYGFNSPSFTGDIIFSSPLLMAPGNGQIGTSQTSSTVWAYSYNGTIYHVDYTITTTILGLEDITTAQSTLKDCIKLSTKGTQTIRETGETATETLYSWHYKGVGLVKQVTSTKSETITASYISGILITYATPTTIPTTLTTTVPTTVPTTVLTTTPTTSTTTTVPTTIPTTSTTTVQPTTTATTTATTAATTAATTVPATTVPATTTATTAATTTATTAATTAATTVPPTVCNTCHGIPPTTGQHTFHVNTDNLSCAICHGSGYSATTVNSATHMNGVTNIVSGIGWNATSRSCTNACHGSLNWGM